VKTKNAYIKKIVKKRSSLGLGLLFGILLATPLLAASGLEGRITTAINELTTIVNILIAGFIVWAGFLIAKGEGSGMTRLIYGVIGLIVVNASYMIVNYFN